MQNLTNGYKPFHEDGFIADKGGRPIGLHHHRGDILGTSCTPRWHHRPAGLFLGPSMPYRRPLWTRWVVPAGRGGCFEGRQESASCSRRGADDVRCTEAAPVVPGHYCERGKDDWAWRAQVSAISMWSGRRSSSTPR